MPNVIELRRYTLRPGRREELIELFEREFVESQEETGMTVLGIFRDLDDPDAFVWLRGFTDMETRLAALTAFYGGPVWAEHGPAASVTMVDVSNCRLLRPVKPFDLSAPPGPLYAALTEEPLDDPSPLAVLVTEDAPNDFPRLPIRTDPVVVTFTRGRPSTGSVLRLEPTARSRVR
ncbi:NIPSNAP family protein [Spirillospora sp. CA-294931]|uniref:NIPSNAP family protein n=1 Tax=Spirillospora sp. CA-294931 TaxID=3240042 RepID=UPI003D9402D0